MIQLIGMWVCLQADPEGKPEDLLQYRISRAYSRPEGVDGSLEAMALASPRFGTRYAATLLQVHKAFLRGRGFESAYRAVLKCSPCDGPAGAADHLKAVAASLKLAVYCPDCKNGKIPCTQCGGKGRTDLPCAFCGGKGRTPAAGAQLGSNAQVKCRNCDGQGTFRNAGCPGCGKSGLVSCLACNGNPWHDACSNPACKGGMTSCGTCGGKGVPNVDCPNCDGGYVRAPGAQLGSNAQMKCRSCEGAGQIKANCGACERRGRVPCDVCQERRKGVKGDASLISAVFSTQACPACSGAGWPEEGKAVACSKCVGLGVKIVPAADPGKILE